MSGRTSPLQHVPRQRVSDRWLPEGRLPGRRLPGGRDFPDPGRGGPAGDITPPSPRTP